MSKKRKYKDEPRYKVIFGYEKSFKDAFSATTLQMSKDIVIRTNELLGRKK